VEFFRSPNIDWLGKKWYFLGFSLIFSVAGVLSMLFWHHIPLGVDFRGGTDAYVKFTSTPDLNKIRTDLDAAGLHNARIQRYDVPSKNEVLIGLSEASNEADLTKGQNQIIDALERTSPASQDPANKTRKDLNNTSVQALTDYLVKQDPLGNGGDAKAYGDIAKQIVNHRNLTRGGVLYSIDELAQAGVDARVISSLKQNFFLANFGAYKVEIVGPTVGRQLQHQAMLAILYSLIGMLVYLWFRFELIYGVAAVVACFHDTLITVGAFSLLNVEISLTVIAAILTLVGYSMNDTIVVFDRIRENIKLNRRERLDVIVNKSINQTLSRTILTSGLTFLTVLSLFVFGGEVLRGFSLALVIGIVIGTYSSIAVAAPMLVAYTDWRARRSGRPVVLPAAKAGKQQQAKPADLKGVKARG
jgi:preprotein translocase subunit SecF